MGVTCKVYYYVHEILLLSGHPGWVPLAKQGLVVKTIIEFNATILTECTENAKTSRQDA